jgi:GTPase
MKQVFLVGRYSVGKSSLFNRITGKRNLVMEEKGTTRDIIQHSYEFEAKDYLLSDSAGLENVSMDTILTHQQEMILNEMKRSDVVVLVVDGTAGIIPQDRELFDFLRKHRLIKRTLLAVNKWDKKNFHPEEFYEFGIEEIYPTSATDGSGVYELMEAISNMSGQTMEGDEVPESRVITLVGKPNAGKSTLMNALMGKSRSLVSSEEFTTRDPVRGNIKRDDEFFTLVDTAGIRSRWMHEFGTVYLSMRRATREIRLAQMVLFLLDAEQPIAREDQKIARTLLDAKKCCVVVVNKKDLIQDRELFQHLMHTRLRFLDTYPVVYISALNKEGFEEMFKALQQSYEAHHRKIPTPQINRTLQRIMMEHPLPMGGLKILYATQVSTAPPTIIFFVNHKEYFTDSVINYFKKHLTQEFSLRGTPIQIKVRNRREKA